MTGQPRIGAVLPQAEIRSGGVAAIRRFALEIERRGYDHLLAFDHVLGADSQSRPDWDGYYDHTTPFLEPLTLFAFLGASTRLLEAGLAWPDGRLQAFGEAADRWCVGAG